MNAVQKKVYKIIYPYFQEIFKTIWDNYDLKIPKYKLNKINFKNLEVLADREDLLKHLPKGAVVAEIGVDKGVFSKKILTITKPSKLFLVDSWDSKRFHGGLHEVKKEFNHEILKNRVEIKIGQSIKIADEFKNNYFDWIYIDTNHSYLITSNELKAYSKKVKRKGIIAGHDFIIGNWNSMLKYGVIEAVYEFCVKNKWEIIYLTMDLWENPSFAIRRI